MYAGGRDGAERVPPGRPTDCIRALMIGVARNSSYFSSLLPGEANIPLSQPSSLRARIFVKREIVSVIVVERTLKRK